MYIHLAVLLLFIYRINGHSQHGKNNPASTNRQPHGSRKMEDFVHDINHIRHDLQGQINKPVEQMTQEEQNFYYFRLHDANNDNYLDGLEVIAAFHHTDDDDEYMYDDATNTNGQNSTQTERIADDELMKLVDDVLKEEDLDRDGLISYDEFKHALEKEKIMST